MAEILCGHCGEQIDVGTETRSVVAACLNGPTLTRDKRPVGRSIYPCKIEEWGSAATRFEYGRPEDPSHIIQTDPPDNDPGEYEKYRVRVLAAAGVGA